jgi:hypothetical protein
MNWEASSGGRATGDYSLKLKYLGRVGFGESAQVGSNGTRVTTPENLNSWGRTAWGEWALERAPGDYT